MARLLRAWTPCALCLSLAASAPAAAHRDPKDQAVTVRSLRDFDACQEDPETQGSEACLDALKRYVSAHPKRAFAAGKRVSRHYMHWVALDFFAPALGAQKAAHKHCDDEDVRSAVIAGLSLPPHYPAVALAQKLVSDACREQLAPVVVAALEETSGHFRANACPLIESQVRSQACALPRETAGVAAPPPPPELPSKAEQMALAPRVREAPPVQREEPRSPPTQRIADVFPSIGALPSTDTSAKPTRAAQAGASERERATVQAQVDADSGELLRGAHGEELLIGRTHLAGREYVLLKFKGVQGPWNERVLLTVERRSDAGRDYLIADDDRQTVVMIERQRQYQAFPKGVKGGLWLNPVRPGDTPDVKLPTRGQIARELASAPAPSK